MATPAEYQTFDEMLQEQNEREKRRLARGPVWLWAAVLLLSLPFYALVFVGLWTGELHPVHRVALAFVLGLFLLDCLIDVVDRAIYKADRRREEQQRGL